MCMCHNSLHVSRGKGHSPVLKETLCLINRFNLLSCADGKPLNIWLQIIRMPASSDVLSAVADGSLLMPFSYTLFVVSVIYSCAF